MATVQARGLPLIGLLELGPQLPSSGFSPWPAITWPGDLRPCDFTAFGPASPHSPQLLVVHSLSKYLLHLLCAKHDSKWRLTAVTKVPPPAEVTGFQNSSQMLSLLCSQAPRSPVG